MSDAKGWIVKTFDGQYLCPRDGDVSTTSVMTEAGVFKHYGEAYETAGEHCDPGFVVVPAHSI
ncbi:hypothetical protein BJG93_36585 (plasmid) [Paraburkholderia sprentiae WSM5005]|uniref:Uncharacterized protein n=1 Tax=Paraburkholderia sprentiae WSM5005 TaxID=754502 RepID=A0A8F4QJ16_9BURK|nr:hypothetical protein [Paraburkholderia sprentiae]QXE07365.1 hypothetical protein BJG93_36585 [Paraburkholderia sprentiae WSM5005]